MNRLIETVVESIQNIFWLRNKKIIFGLQTLNKRPKGMCERSSHLKTVKCNIE